MLHAAFAWRALIYLLSTEYFSFAMASVNPPSIPDSLLESVDIMCILFCTFVFAILDKEIHMSVHILIFQRNINFK